MPFAKPETVKTHAFCLPEETIARRALLMIPVATREERSRLLRELSR